MRTITLSRGRALVAAAATALLLTACASGDVAPRPTSTASAAGGEAELWEYAGVAGPDNWGDLDAENTACATGKHQSPVDLPAASSPGTPPAGSVPVTVETEPTTGTILDTGHTDQLVPVGEASTVEYDGDTYELQQLHFHTPSEHTIGGERAPAEFHLVHADAEGHVLVIGVLVRESAASAAWQPYIDAVTAGDGTEAGFDVGAMLPVSLDHDAYEGSLTTPPCTEHVQWLVLTTPVELSSEQLSALESVYDHTARPTQPLDGRQITAGTGVLERG